MYTKHAVTRIQQRGISYQAVEAIIDYGVESQRNGGHVYLCTKSVMGSMLHAGLKPAFVERCKGLYVVIQNGIIKTVAHKHTRFKH
jgi:hypothetical protein